MTFQQLNLNANVFKAIKACGYTNPTPIQAQSIPTILDGKDIVASAQTGTGKTAAFVLPALHLLSLKKQNRHPRVLILSPTRELATQIKQAVDLYGKFMHFSSVSLVGGMPYGKQLKSLSGPIDIIIATPGRLLDHMNNRKLDLSHIEMFILDEADRMLDMGFIDDVTKISKATSKQRQTLLFSATVDKRLTRVINQLLTNPVFIDFSQKVITPEKIKQKLFMADNLQHKTRLLEHFIENENIYKAIIFSATKINADRLADELKRKGHAAAALHGNLNQHKRNKVVDQLRKGNIQFLVATDVAARGINITDITHVFNYDLPKFSEDYVHRIGRTGRAGKSGIAISFALPSDKRHLKKIEQYINFRLQADVIPGLEPSKSSDAPSFGKKRPRKSFTPSKNRDRSFSSKPNSSFKPSKPSFKKNPFKKRKESKG